MNFKASLECVTGWLLGLPTTFFLFVEDDLNNTLQETSVSSH